MVNFLVDFFKFSDFKKIFKNVYSVINSDICSKLDFQLHPNSEIVKS